MKLKYKDFLRLMTEMGASPIALPGLMFLSFGECRNALGVDIEFGSVDEILQVTDTGDRAYLDGKRRELARREVELELSFEKAINAFRCAPDGSEEKTLILQKAIARASSVEQIHDIIACKVETNHILIPFLHKKWCELSLKEIEEAQGARTLHFLSSVIPREPAVQERFRTRLRVILLKNIDDARTFPEAKAACLTAEPGSEERLIAIQKVVNLVPDLKTIAEVYWELLTKEAKEGEAGALVLAKWNELAEKEALAIKTVDDAQHVHILAPSNSESSKRAYSEWMRLSLQEIMAAQNYKEAAYTYERAPKILKLQALEKMIEFASTKEQGSEALILAIRETPRGSATTLRAIRKVSSFCGFNPIS